MKKIVTNAVNFNVVRQLKQILSKSEITKVAISKLSFLKGVNRDVNERRVEKIQKSILTIGEFLGVFIVAKNPRGKGYIILDAQHRYSAFKDVKEQYPNLLVNCIVSQATNMKDIVSVMKLLNSTAGKWVLENYINAFAGLGNPDYITLKKELANNILTTGTLPMLFSMEGRASTQKAIEDGVFLIKNKNWKKNLAQIKECKEIGVIPTSGNGKRIFMEALVSLVLSKEYNHNKFVSNLKKVKQEDFIKNTSQKEAGKVKEYYLQIQNSLKVVYKAEPKATRKKAA